MRKRIDQEDQLDERPNGNCGDCFPGSAWPLSASHVAYAISFLAKCLCCATRLLSGRARLQPCRRVRALIPALAAEGGPQPDPVSPQPIPIFSTPVSQCSTLLWETLRFRRQAIRFFGRPAAAKSAPRAKSSETDLPLSFRVKINRFSLPVDAFREVA